jgi:hypothetical protein
MQLSAFKLGCLHIAQLVTVKVYSAVEELGWLLERAVYYVVDSLRRSVFVCYYKPPHHAIHGRFTNLNMKNIHYARMLLLFENIRAIGVPE